MRWNLIIPRAYLQVHTHHPYLRKLRLRRQTELGAYGADPFAVATGDSVCREAEDTLQFLPSVQAAISADPFRSTQDPPHESALITEADTPDPIANHGREE